MPRIKSIAIKADTPVYGATSPRDHFNISDNNSNSELQEGQVESSEGIIISIIGVNGKDEYFVEASQQKYIRETFQFHSLKSLSRAINDTTNYRLDARITNNSLDIYCDEHVDITFENGCSCTHDGVKTFTYLPAPGLVEALGLDSAHAP